MFKRILLVTCFLVFASQAFATSYNCNLRPGQRAFGNNETLTLDLTSNQASISKTELDFVGNFNLSSEKNAELVYSGWTYYDIYVSVAIASEVLDQAESFKMRLSMGSEEMNGTGRTFLYFCTR